MNKRRGFTLIEMLAVLAILGVLLMAAHPVHELMLRRTQEQALREGLRSLRQALDAHRDAVLAGRISANPQGSPWPARLQDLVDGVPLMDDSGRPRSDGARLYLLRRLPRDPFADPALPAAQTWLTRASTSPPEAPAPGDDVFDVRVPSEGLALDGSSYRQW